MKKSKKEMKKENERKEKYFKLFMSLPVGQRVKLDEFKFDDLVNLFSNCGFCNELKIYEKTPLLEREFKKRGIIVEDYFSVSDLIINILKKRPNQKYK